jgi:hypothetical protein
MKFTIANKEFEIQPAKTRSVIAIEARLGKSIAKMQEDFSFTDIVEIVAIALNQADPEVNRDWVEENTGVKDIEIFNSVITHFLAQTK